jgi:hypothetical protein
MSEPNVYELSDSESDDDDDMFLVNQDAQSFSVDENSDYSDDEDVSLVTDSTDANDDDEDMDDIEENQPMLLEPQKDCSSLFPDLLQISAASNFKPPNVCTFHLSKVLIFKDICEKNQKTTQYYGILNKTRDTRTTSLN